MRACVQRVTAAAVHVEGKTCGRIEAGLVVLLGVGHDDGEADVRYLADKIIGLRIFDDEEGKMNRSVTDIGGSLLVVSQFTLWADCRKGRRPSYVAAAPAPIAEKWYEHFAKSVRAAGVPVETGRFQTHMQVELTNDGPVTIWLDSRDK